MKIRILFFWCHLTAGLLLGLILLGMSLTGALMAFKPQLVAGSEANVRFVPPPADSPRLSLESLIEKAAIEKPGAAVTRIGIKNDPRASVTVFFGKNGLFVDPYTGKVLGGPSQLNNAMSKIEDFHRTLGAGKTGKKITGTAACALLFLIGSGIYLWWPQQWNTNVRQTILFFKPGVTGKARDWNWHNVIGFWASPFLLITVLTGLIMSFSWANRLLLYLAGGSVPEAAPAAMAAAANPEKPKWDLYFDSAKKIEKDWKSMTLWLPQKPGGNVVVWFDKKKQPHPYARSKAEFDFKTGTFVFAEAFSEQTRGKQARSWVRVLHTGEAWGLFGQTVMFLAAMGVAVLVWTGFSLSWRRFFSKPKKKAVPSR